MTRGALDRTEKARVICEAALDRKAERPVALDVRELTAFTDTFVLLSGNSDRQVRAIADSITRAMKEHGERPLGIEGLQDGRWVLIDYNDTVVHVFDHEMRDHYDLERLWSDAVTIDLELEPETALAGPGR